MSPVEDDSLTLDGDIVIGAVTYRVKWEPEAFDVKGETCIGHIDNEKTEIKVVMGLPHDRVLNTLLHEIVHGLIYEYGMGKSEESRVDLWATALQSLFRQNPWLAGMIHNATQRPEGRS